jgi:glutamate/tyrosine decarboxylase-like PLP-dependent enzyme
LITISRSIATLHTYRGIRKYEAETVAMVVAMLGGATSAGGADEACGVFTSGGTESVLMAMLGGWCERLLV